MKNSIYFILGGSAVIGLGLVLYMKSKSTNPDIPSSATERQDPAENISQKVSEIQEKSVEDKKYTDAKSIIAKINEKYSTKPKNISSVANWASAIKTLSNQLVPLGYSYKPGSSEPVKI